MTRIWTEDEIFYLKGNYGKLPNRVLANKLERTIGSVQHKAQALKLTTSKIVKNRPWSKEEEHILQCQYQKKSYEQIAKKLKRTKSSVKKKAMCMGLIVDEKEYFSLRTLSGCFNSEPSVVHRWMKHGLPYKTIRRGKTHVFQIDGNKFWKWASTHKELIPFERYQEYSILPEPHWLREEIKSHYQFNRNRTPITSKDISYVITQRNSGKSFTQIAIDLQRTTNSIIHIYRDNKDIESKKSKNAFLSYK